MEMYKKLKIIIDVGCWVFYFGKQIINLFRDYIGLDVSDEILQHNRIDYPQVKFLNIYAVEYTIPMGDVVVIRKGWTHMPNEMFISR